MENRISTNCIISINLYRFFCSGGGFVGGQPIVPVGGIGGGFGGSQSAANAGANAASQNQAGFGK